MADIDCATSLSWGCAANREMTPSSHCDSSATTVMMIASRTANEMLKPVTNINCTSSSRSCGFISGSRSHVSHGGSRSAIHRAAADAVPMSVIRSKYSRRIPPSRATGNGCMPRPAIPPSSRFISASSLCSLFDTISTPCPSCIATQTGLASTVAAEWKGFHPNGHLWSENVLSTLQVGHIVHDLQCRNAVNTLEP